MIPKQVLLRLEPRKHCMTHHFRETMARRVAIAPFGPSVAIYLLSGKHNLEYPDGGVASCMKATETALQRQNLRRHRASIPSISQDHDL
jgi:hypothetical protein